MSNESNAFSMSIVTKKPIILAIFVISDNILPFLPVDLFLTYAVFCKGIKSGKTFFSFSKRAFDIILDLHSTKKWVSRF